MLSVCGKGVSVGKTAAVDGWVGAEPDGVAGKVDVPTGFVLTGRRWVAELGRSVGISITIGVPAGFPSFDSTALTSSPFTR
ncbi:MAG: hypothetical protein A2Z14_10920 [Chloroflexi bacterium RBG_16_48_8]|nr:MAG: hypothetical protein A2Z14_10920 [Chloroflexi bacterium RBG_16_48_8]